MLTKRIEFVNTSNYLNIYIGGNAIKSMYKEAIR